MSEVYSVPRVGDAASRFPRLGVMPRTALDLTTVDEEGNPWDFSIPSQRAKAEKLLDKEKPTLLVGSPMCTLFSNMQNLNKHRRDPRVIQDEIDRARIHLAWCCKLYRSQVERGAYFLHEHPKLATSWMEPCIRGVLAIKGVGRVDADQCQLGQQDDLGQPIRKPTGFMSNSPEILRALSVQCQGRRGACTRPQGGRHVQCIGVRARRAAIFQDELCLAMLRGLKRQLIVDGRMRENEVGVVSERNQFIEGSDEMKAYLIGASSEGADRVLGPKSAARSRPHVCQFSRHNSCLAGRNAQAHHDSRALKFTSRDDRYIDDLTGLPLRPELCVEARRQEIEYFRSKCVWELRPIAEARRRMGRSPISVRWVETNKGDDDNPNVRSRLVAREIRTAGQNAIFAPTPPLESLRMVLIWAATDLLGGDFRKHVRDPSSDDRTQVLLIDISRAYFNAKTDPRDPIYVELPPEAGAPPGMCGLLRRHMYGTRRAAEGWQDEYSSALVDMGFTQGAASPCVFVHAPRRIVVSVHGDDFTAAGSKQNLDWFEKQMKERYELKVGGRLGPGPTDDKEATVLNRVIRWTPQGLEYEADPRQVERLLEELELEGEGVKSVVTPGVKTLAHQVQSEVVLPEREHTRFRALAARANYLAADRPDVIFAAKEVCRLMSKPTDLGMAALKRLGRYLRRRPRLVFQMPFQTAERWDVYTDTDWAGCVRTRKSTSGGCLLLGSHVIKCWSATQASLALSSGKAEYYGVVRGAGIGLGQQALGKDAGFPIPLRIWTDSSASIGTASRQGLGKLRHLECHSLWVQQRLRRREFELRKVDGTSNPADLFTKHMDSSSKLEALVKLFGCSFREGRPSAAPELKRQAQASTNAVSAQSVCSVASGPRVLPHQLPRRLMDQHHPCAIPEDEAHNEPDETPQEELADPIPRLRRLRGGRLGGSQRTAHVTNSCAHVVEEEEPRSVGASDAEVTPLKSARESVLPRAEGECVDQESPRLCRPATSEECGRSPCLAAGRREGARHRHDGAQHTCTEYASSSRREPDPSQGLLGLSPLNDRREPSLGASPEERLESTSSFLEGRANQLPLAVKRGDGYPTPARLHTRQRAVEDRCRSTRASGRPDRGRTQARARTGCGRKGRATRGDHHCSPAAPLDIKKILLRLSLSLPQSSPVHT